MAQKDAYTDIQTKKVNASYILFWDIKVTMYMFKLTRH